MVQTLFFNGLNHFLYVAFLFSLNFFIKNNDIYNTNLISLHTLFNVSWV